ncbi:MAG: hypothetical protein RLO06_18635 [Parvibaculum sp.]
MATLATARQARFAPGAPAGADACAIACGLVDRQWAALAAELPEMVDAAGMRPVELWFVWGVLAELLDDDVDPVRQALADYLRRRHRRPAEEASVLATAVQRACTVHNGFVDGVALGGRQAARGADDRSFLAAALFLQHALPPMR